MKHSESCKEIFAALSKMGGEIQQPSLDGKVKISTKSGSSFEYKYATLAEVQKVLKEPLKNNGLSISHGEAFEEGNLFLVSLLTHKSGEWIRYSSPIHGQFNNDPKIFGGAKTYSRRYALYGIFNLYGQEDTDAQELNDENSSKDQIITTHQLRTLDSLMKKNNENFDRIKNYINKKFSSDRKELKNLTKEEASSVIKKLIEELNKTEFTREEAIA